MLRRAPDEPERILRKRRILITYTDSDICFEDCMTAESVLLANDGTVIHSNFDAEKNEYFKAYLKHIKPVLKLKFQNRLL